MKKIIGILTLVLLSSSWLMAGKYHYYHQGKALSLEINTQYAYLLVKDIPSPGSLESLVGGITVTKMDAHLPAQTLNLVPGTDGLEKGKLIWAEVKFDRALSEGDYLKKLERLEREARIVYTAPYFSNEEEEKIGMSDLFLVRLQGLGNVELLQDLARETGTIIVGQNRFMSDWYTLSCNQNSKGNAMEMANYFYESKLFIDAQPDLMVDVVDCPTDPLFVNQWGMNNTGQSGGTVGLDINACSGWSNWSTGDIGTVVAVLDHGYEQNHPDLTANNVGTGFDTESGTTPALVLGSHGTACAGIVAAPDYNGVGVSGVAPDCGLMSISNSLAGTPNSRQKRADGFNWAWQNGADVISNSWSSGVAYAVIDNAIQNALDNGRGGLGTVIVFSAGNGNGAVSYPANSNPDIIVVGAMSPCGERKNPASCDGENWWGSDFGAELDVVAPGVLIQTTDRQGTAGYNTAAGVVGDYFATFNGTSSACPHVAGLAGLIISMNPCLSHEQVAEIIGKTAQKVGGYGYATTAGYDHGTWDNEMGYGLIDIDAAMQMTRELYLQNETITGTETFQVQGEIFAGNSVTTAVPNGDFIVDAGADVEFNAVDGILLDAGFRVNLGAEFLAQIIGSGCADWDETARQAQPGPVAELPAETGSDPSFVLGTESISDLSLAPNPFSEYLVLRFSIADESADVSAKLYDLQGRAVAEVLAEGPRARGAYREEISSLQALPAGIYVLRMQVAGRPWTLKVVKQ